MKPDNPFVGLNYFVESKAPFFFGRDAERKMIIGNLRASRLTLLYAQSGVGKSSLLRAGVAARLRDQAQRNAAEEGTPSTFPVVFNAWRDDPVGGLIVEIEAAARTFARNGSTLQLPRDSLDDAIKSASDALEATPLVMLDQFEDYFLYHSHDEQGERFAESLARCVRRDDLPVNFLISIREDAYSNIGDRFKAQIPNVYGNYLHLDYLDRASAREAIVQPVEEVNRALPEDAPQFEVEPQLVEDVLDQVRRRRGVEDQAEHDGNGASSERDHERFETAFLQLVMERLWDEEAREESHVLRAETLRRLGGADTISQEHVDLAMAELPDDQREAVALGFRFLVTSAGRKIALTTHELAGFSGRPDAVLDPALRHLERERILRAVAAPVSSSDEGPEGPDEKPSTRWELFHDILAEPVLRWRSEADARIAQERLHEAHEETRRAKRRSMIWLGLAGLALVLMVVAAAQWRSAVNARAETRSQEFASASVVSLSSDPHGSVQLALKGLHEADTIEAENALRTAVPASRLRSVLPHNGGGTGSGAGGNHPFVTSAAFGGHDTLATTDSTGGVRVWNWKTRRELVRVREPGWATNVDFAADGRLFLVYATTRATLWDVEACQGGRSCKPLRTWRNPYLYMASMSDDACAVATATYTTVRVYGLSKCAAGARCRPGERQTLSHGEGFIWVDVASDACALAAVTTDGTLSVWRYRDGRYRLAHRLDGHWNQAWNVALSRHGELVAGSGDRNFRVWDLRKCEGTGRGPTACRLMRSEQTPDWAGGVAFSPDGTQLAVASEDGVARVWDLAAPEPLLVLRGHRDTIFSTAFDSSGRHLATASADATARVWSVWSGKLVSHNRKAVVDARFMADGRRIVTASDDGTVRIYDRNGRGSEKAVLLVTAPSKVLSPAERRRWDETPLGDSLARAGTAVTSAAPSPDGRWVITGTRDGRLERWSVSECVSDFVCEWWRSESFGGSQADPALGGVNTIAYDPQGRLVAVAWQFGGTRILSARGARRAVIDEGVSQAANAAFNSRGTRLVTTNTAGDARIWDVSDCVDDSCKPKFLRTLAHPCVVYTAAFSPDGSRVITGCGDRRARIWKWRDPESPPVVLHGHESNIRSAVFTPDGRRAVTVGTDRTTRIWDAASGDILGVLRMHTDRVQSVAVDPNDPAAILSASDDGTTRLYRCTTCGTLDELRSLAERRRRHVAARPLLIRSG